MDSCIWRLGDRSEGRRGVWFLEGDKGMGVGDGPGWGRGMGMRREGLRRGRREKAEESGQIIKNRYRNQKMRIRDIKVVFD